MAITCAAAHACTQVEVLKQRPDVEVITVRKDNRDSLVVEICSRMQQTLLQMRQ